MSEVIFILRNLVFRKLTLQAGRECLETFYVRKLRIYKWDKLHGSLNDLDYCQLLLQHFKSNRHHCSSQS